MTIQTPVFHRLDDPNDPIRHGTPPERVPAAMVARHNEWARLQNPQPNYFCEHGSYVGYDRALAYLCPMCPEQ